MWRFGGKRNQFTYVNDPLGGPSYQHDIRVLPNGNITLMDNGNFHTPSLSRAVEYHFDTGHDESDYSYGSIVTRRTAIHGGWGMCSVFRTATRSSIGRMRPCRN
jgi:hypothetical protein